MNLDINLGSPASGPPRAEALRQAAAAYVLRGWRVLPLWWPATTGDCACGLTDCESVGKHPISRLVPHGLHDATSDVDTIGCWWSRAPFANIGIRTGAESGLVVVDVDGEAGLRSLRALITSHVVIRPTWARTGPGGWHAYFAHPGIAVPNSTGRLGEGLDVRGDGGYVVAPPSLHASRRLYRWAGPPPEGEEPLPHLPDWLLELAMPQAPAEAERGPIQLRTDDIDAYVAAVVERETRDVAGAPPGQRNDRLNRAAFKLGQLVGAGLLDETVAAAALVAAGLAAGPGERKIRSTVSRGLDAGRDHPRQIVLDTTD
jgi:Bifunctional DNA primase/polymerase, N-terminal